MLTQAEAKEEKKIGIRIKPGTTAILLTIIILALVQSWENGVDEVELSLQEKEISSYCPHHSAETWPCHNSMGSKSFTPTKYR